MSAQVIALKGVKMAPKAQRSQMDTLELTMAVVGTWKLPAWQRPKKINAKVHAVACEIRRSEVIPGTITLGTIGKDVYVIDGQHRLAAFELSGLDVAYADVRMCDFDTIAEMGNEFVNLNMKLVAFRPDDVLRGLEGVIPGLALIRKHCEFIGYSNIRRGDASGPVISMSTALRCWYGSAGDVPGSTTTSAADLAKNMTEDEANQMIQIMNVAAGAWGRDPEYLALSADQSYLDWLVGRNLTDRDRSPCYARIKAAFTKRLVDEIPGKKAMFPAPGMARGRPMTVMTNVWGVFPWNT